MINISFFSYKGGSGRTSLLYNTLPYLAESLHATPEEPIIVLDLDVDSKGLSFLLKGPNNSTSEINSLEIIAHDNYIESLIQDKDKLLYQMLPIGSLLGLGEDMNRSVLFVSASPNSRRVSLGANNFDSVNADISYFCNICEDYNCKAFVMDTPAGGQLSADVALRISNKIVTAMRITRQFREGTIEFLDRHMRDLEKNYIIVPNVVPVDNEHSKDGNDVTSKMKLILNRIDDLRAKNLANETNNSYNTQLILDHEGDSSNLSSAGINEVRRFKFEEANLNYLSSKQIILREDEKKAIEKYKILTEMILDGDH